MKELHVPGKLMNGLSRIADFASAKAIVLFGSRVRGEARTDSDWDICVIVPDDAPRDRIMPTRLRRLLDRPGVPVDLVVMRESRFRDQAETFGWLAHEIATEGVTVFGAMPEREAA